MVAAKYLKHGWRLIRKAENGGGVISRRRGGAGGSSVGGINAQRGAARRKLASSKRSAAPWCIKVIKRCGDGDSGKKLAKSLSMAGASGGGTRSSGKRRKHHRASISGGIRLRHRLAAANSIAHQNLKKVKENIRAIRRGIRRRRHLKMKAKICGGEKSPLGVNKDRLAAAGENENEAAAKSWRHAASGARRWASSAARKWRSAAGAISASGGQRNSGIKKSGAASGGARGVSAAA